MASEIVLGINPDYVPASRRAYHYRAVSCIDKSGREWVCEYCGAYNNLQVHHVDNDYKNNNINNLKILCSKCHGLEHPDIVIPNVGRRGKLI